MGWKQLNDKNMTEICSRCAYCSRELLDDLIQEYALFYYDDDYTRVPLLRNLKDAIPEHIFDHALLMKSISGEQYLVSNPYCDDETITKALGEYLGTKVFKVLGMHRSYYNPNSTNLFLIDLTYFTR
jgi:hypothetical protein